MNFQIANYLVIYFSFLTVLISNFTLWGGKAEKWCL